MNSNSSEAYIINRTPMYKILILGESNVGKTSLIKRYVDDSFPIDYKATIGVDYKIKCLNINESEAVKLSIWDTAGQERYRSIARSYLNNAQGIILTFDICDRNSFNEISNFWINFAGTYAKESNCILILVGTKFDRKENRKVLFSEAKQLANELGVFYFETSSMKNVNVNDMFLHLTKEIHNLLEKIPKIENNKERNDNNYMKWKFFKVGIENLNLPNSNKMSKSSNIINLVKDSNISNTKSKTRFNCC
jgi:small GTP-binding protein